MVLNYTHKSKSIYIISFLLILLLVGLIWTGINYLSLHRYKNVAHFDQQILIYNDQKYIRIGDSDAQYTVDELLGEVELPFNRRLYTHQLIYSVKESSEVVAITTIRNGFAYYQVLEE